MITLADASPGQMYTVKKVTGGRKVAGILENCGVAAGSDISLLEQKDGVIRISALGGREFSVDAAYAENIQLTEQFKRGSSDPVFIGCCSGGNAKLIDYIDKVNEKNLNQSGDIRVK